MFPAMSTEKLEASIKTRVATTTKEALEKIAATRHLDVSDIVREAVREYVAKSDNAGVVQQPEAQRVAA